MPIDMDLGEEIVWKSINELKKKIQLSEGQRKAKFELSGIEKKKNAERISQLKSELKQLCTDLGKPVKSEEIIKQRCKSAKSDLQPLGHKSPDEALAVVQHRLIDLNKKLDLLVYGHNKLELKLLNLEELRDHLQIEAGKVTRARRKSAENNPERKKMSSLENKIHHTELNAMEAETIKRKYLAIKSNLAEDAVKYEATLLKVEDDIKAQSEEISKLQRVRSEALGVRDATRSLLVRQEENAIRVARERERRLQEQRMVVEERRAELESLEHRLFPASGGAGGPQMHRDSVASLDNLGLTPGEDQQQPQHSPNHYFTSAVEEAFKKLMVATGEVEPDMVTLRFKGQKETRNRLTYLRGLTEEDKRKMESTRADLVAQLEHSKFTAEVKSKEINLEEVEELKSKIEKEEASSKDIAKKIIDRGTTKEMIMKSMLEMYNSLKEFNLNEEKVDTEGKDLDHIALLFVEDAVIAAHKLAQQKQEEQKMRERASHSRLGSRAGYTTQQSSSERTELPPVTHTRKEVESEEEEVPSRAILKRQAQTLVDAKSRRRFFRPGRTKKI